MVIDMNQNDMDRYFWRAGQRRSGDDRPVRAPLPVERPRSRTIWFLFVTFLVTLVVLFLLRLGR